MRRRPLRASDPPSPAGSATGMLPPVRIWSWNALMSKRSPQLLLGHDCAGKGFSARPACRKSAWPGIRPAYRSTSAAALRFGHGGMLGHPTHAPFWMLQPHLVDAGVDDQPGWPAESRSSDVHSIATDRSKTPSPARATPHTTPSLRHKRLVMSKTAEMTADHGAPRRWTSGK